LHLSFTARDGVRYWLRIAISTYLPAFDVPIRWDPFGISPRRVAWKNENNVATRQLKILKICLFVLTESKNVTDGRVGKIVIF